jgi:hypothetical protein
VTMLQLRSTSTAEYRPCKVPVPLSGFGDAQGPLIAQPEIEQLTRPVTQ